MTLTLDEHAIANQKIAVGLVENACCWRLRDLAREVPADQAVVELGAFKGRSTGWLALGASQGNGARVTSVDPWEDGEQVPADYARTAVTIREYRLSETRLAYEAHLDRTGVRPLVDTIQATAVEAAKSWTGPKVGLLWHDALHRFEDVRDDLTAWLPHMASTAVIVCHDIGERRFGVQAGAEAALTRTKALRETWDWEGRELNLWAKTPGKRGFMLVRTR